MTNHDDRRKELAVLVDTMRSHPSAPHETERDRAWVLSRMLASPAR